VTPEAEQLFVSYNSQRRDDLSLTAVLLKANVIYLLQGCGSLIFKDNGEQNIRVRRSLTLQ
jgi:hypothetical protein